MSSGRGGSSPSRRRIRKGCGSSRLRALALSREIPTMCRREKHGNANATWKTDNQWRAVPRDVNERAIIHNENNKPTTPNLSCEWFATKNLAVAGENPSKKSARPDGDW